MGCKVGELSTGAQPRTFCSRLGSESIPGRNTAVFASIWRPDVQVKISNEGEADPYSSHPTVVVFDSCRGYSS